MSNFIPYISRQIIDPNENNCFDSVKSLQTSLGLMRYHVYTDPEHGKQLIPIAFFSISKRASVEFHETSAIIRLHSGDKSLTLSPQGVSQLMEDENLRNSLLILRRDLWVGLMESSALTGIQLPAALIDQTLQTGVAISDYTRRQPELECVQERVVTTVTEQLTRWVDIVKTAAQQLAECTEACLNETWWQVPFCIGGCAIKSFIDIVVGTYQVIETTTREIVTYITHCIEVSRLPLPVGHVPANEVISPQLEIYGQGAVPIEPGDMETSLSPFRAILECVVNGEWHIWTLELNKIGIDGALPLGIEVCFDKQCADSIRRSITLGHFLGISSVVGGLLAGGKSAEVILTAIAKIPWLNAGLTKIAALVGLTLTQAVLIVFAFVVLLAYHALAIAGQIQILEWRGRTVNGVCMKHPLFVLAGAATLSSPTVVGPIITAQIGLHIPVIVTGR